MSLTFYNTLGRKKEEFQPLEKGVVKMYHCGPTVYQYAHIGNLRAYVFADILRRTLEVEGYEVKQVMNITDVGHLVSDSDEGEDKMESAAKGAGKTAQEIALFYTDAFLKDLALLNIKTPAYLPKATEHIPEQIALIKQLEEKGFTYTINDGVYFDTSKFESYAELALLHIEGMEEGARVEANPEKKNPADFALWKLSKSEEKRQQEWDSPWGVGFPGWHIECSAMSMKYLGETLDIHTGGIDHIPVHHTNERAQSEAATGKKFVNYWMHSAFLNLEGEKIAKSLGNTIRLEELMGNDISPLSYRYFLLTANYRTFINFSWEAVHGAHSALLRLHRHFAEWDEDDNAKASDVYGEKFRMALEDDLNTAVAIATLWDVVKDESLSGGEKRATITLFEKVLGLGFGMTDVELVDFLIKTETAENEGDLPVAVQNLLKEREVAREKKDWARADELRDEIFQLGYKVLDTADGIEVLKIK